MPKYSIVVPFHNEEENVTTLYDRLKAVMESVGDSFELVLVDDGSNDRTYKLLEEIAAVDSRVLVVKLRRNFGQTSALAAGFDHAQGDYILAMDGDLQHDPAEIPDFLAKLEEGYDVVSGWRKERIDNFVMRRIPSRCANWLMAKLSVAWIFTISARPSRLTGAKSSTTSRSTARCTALSPRWPHGTAPASAKFRSAM